MQVRAIGWYPGHAPQSLVGQADTGHHRWAAQTGAQALVASFDSVINLWYTEWAARAAQSYPNPKALCMEVQCERGIGILSGLDPPLFFGIRIRRDGLKRNLSYRSCSMMLRMRRILILSTVSSSVPCVRAPLLRAILSYAVRNKSSLYRLR